MVKSTSEFKVTEKDLQDVAKKRKNWSAPGIDGITNYWWKTLTATRKPLARAMQKWVDDNTTIPQWIAVGRTVLLPKAKDLSPEEEYRPITCLNTSYKLFTGILAKFMKEHAEENEIWDRNQMGTCQDVLGTVDQLLIDNCIMEEVRIHKRNFMAHSRGLSLASIRPNLHHAVRAVIAINYMARDHFSIAYY